MATVGFKGLNTFLVYIKHSSTYCLKEAQILLLWYHLVNKLIMKCHSKQ